MPDVGEGALEPVWLRARQQGGLDHTAPAGPVDLAGRSWHRGAGAAIGVLAAATLGLVLGGLGSFVAAAVATVFGYGVGPVVFWIELRRWPVGAAPTTASLARHWGVAAVATVVVVAAVPVVAGGADQVPFALWLLALGGPIAAGATAAAVVLAARLPALAVRAVATVVPAGLLLALAREVTRTPGATRGVVDAALVVATLVLVPLTVPLVAPGGHARRSSLASLVLLAGGWAAVAVVLDAGPFAVAAAVPWSVTAVVLAAAAARRWLRRPSGEHLAVAVAAGYLAVGALWLVADRAAYEPAGFGPPFVQLTAVHFTYAGAVGTVLAVLAWRRRPGDRVAALAVVATAAAPPLVAAGFVAYGPLQIAGALLLTAGTYAYAWVVLRHLVRGVGRVARYALGASAVSVLVPMVLAVQWAIGANLGTPALSIPAMAATHGVANALGFCLVGVLGWRRVARLTPARQEPR